MLEVPARHSNGGVGGQLDIGPKHLYIPGGPMVKNLPSNAGDTDSITGLVTVIPYAAGQLSLRTAMREQPNK